MSYWVIHERGTEDGRTEFHGELFDTYLEALVYSKVQQADRGRNAEVYEAYECGHPDCEALPEWGFEFCDDCLAEAEG